MHNNKYRLRNFIFIGILLLLLASGLFIYNKKLQENLSSTVCTTLEEIMKQQKFNFYSKIMAEDKAIRTFSVLLSNEDDYANILESLKFIKKNSSFEYVALINSNGVGILENGNYHTFNQNECFHRALSGETVISELTVNNDNELPLKLILFSTPVFNNNREITGVLVAAYNAKQLDNLFLSSFSDKGFAFVTDSDGNIIARTPNTYNTIISDNFFSLLQESQFYEYDNLATIVKRIANDDHGHSKYIYQGGKFFVHYTSIGVNNWKLFSIAPEQVFLETSYNIFISATLLTILLVAIVGAQGLYVYKVQKSYIKDLYITAFIDELTGAGNFQKFKADAELLLRKHNNPETYYTIIKLDVDRFKLINTIYGHDVGDKILTIISSVLKVILDPRIDTFARLSSDEFLILINYKVTEELNIKRKIFEDAVTEQVSSIIDFKMTMPEGRYDILQGELDITGIFEKVNFAHRLAKHSDSRSCYYDDSIKAVAIQEKELENKMESALLNGEFIMFLQPKYRLTDEKIIGAEVLSRWKINDTFISPAIFIPLFEQNGFITKLDFYMFEETCKNLRKWIDDGIDPVTISVNFSRLHLANKNFVEQLAELADKYAIPHHLLEIEITETAIFDNIKFLSTVLEKLHQYGFTLSMDDFGSGYSSLGLLKNLPVDVIKIDRAFFDESTNINREKAIIAGVITMAQNLNITTVAEGVETKLHIDLLKDLKCDIVQGYYYSRPLPLKIFEEKLYETTIAQKHI